MGYNEGRNLVCDGGYNPKSNKSPPQIRRTNCNSYTRESHADISIPSPEGKQKSGSRARESIKILENLNTVLQNRDSTVHEIEEAEVKLTKFDEEYIRQILQKKENYRMFDG